MSMKELIDRAEVNLAEAQACVKYAQDSIKQMRFSLGLEDLYPLEAFPPTPIESKADSRAKKLFGETMAQEDKRREYEKLMYMEDQRRNKKGVLETDHATGGQRTVTLGTLKIKS